MAVGTQTAIIALPNTWNANCFQEFWRKQH
jgi:hypothetical protein